MASRDDVRLWTDSLRTERDAVALYEALAAAETHPDLSGLYRRLAETERKHAAVWESRLAAAGVAIPPPRIGWRFRMLAWLARRFGPGLVLPTLVAIEKGAGADYGGQPGTVESEMARDERSHARLFSHLARTSRGLEGSAVARFEGRHRSTGGNALRAGVLGANDGLVSNLSLVMGVAGAAMSSTSILITGLAGLLAGAISMALGEWLSVQSSRELYQHQMDVERRELAEGPEEEKEELALIYQAKGVAPADARRLADSLLSNPETALDTLVREELGIDPGELGGSAWEAAGTSFLLFAVGAIIPVAPFFFLSGPASIAVSAAVSAIGLFVIGAAITLVTGRSVLWSGFRQVIFGLAAAAITFGIGRIVGVHLGG